MINTSMSGSPAANGPNKESAAEAIWETTSSNVFTGTVDRAKEGIAFTMFSAVLVIPNGLFGLRQILLIGRPGTTRLANLGPATMPLSLGRAVEGRSKVVWSGLKWGAR